MDKDIFPKLGPIIIGTTDNSKAKEFYIAVFGITIDEESNHYISAHCPDGTHIELEEDSEHRFPNWAKNNIGTYKCSEFIVEDIHQFLENVQKHGGKILTKPVPRPWGGFAAEFLDPDNNIFLIQQK